MKIDHVKGYIIEIILGHREAILIDKGPLAVQNIYLSLMHVQGRTKGGATGAVPPPGPVRGGHCPPLGYRLRKKGRKNSEILFHSYYPKS